MFFQSIKQNLCAHYPGLQAKRDLEMIYKSIAERLRIRLNSADFTLNSLLPGEKKLAEEFAVSRMTIRKAIDLLVAWGWWSAATVVALTWCAKMYCIKPPV